MDPAQRSLRSRIAAHILHAQRDPRDTTAAARQAFLDRFERQVDPEGVLAPSERTRRAKQARHAHFLQLALKSSKARSAASSRRHKAGGGGHSEMADCDD